MPPRVVTARDGTPLRLSKVRCECWKKVRLLRPVSNSEVWRAALIGCTFESNRIALLLIECLFQFDHFITALDLFVTMLAKEIDQFFIRFRGEV